MDQLQCPNCGGYKITTPYGGITKDMDAAVWLYVFGVLSILAGLLIWGGWAIGVGVFMFLGGVLVSHDYDKYSSTHHKCKICGKEWETPG
jgi:ribosomal protein S27E